MLKNKIAKRIISLLMVYVLAFSSIMPAFAEEANVSEATSSIEALTEPVIQEVQSITAQSASTVGQSAYEYMSYLGNTIGTRVAGSVYAMQARDYIKGEFEKMPGLSSVVVQPFTNGSKQLYNVIATKVGASNRTIYIGAHYDSVSSGGSKGVDDNASGVGVLLETAKAVAQLNTAYTIKFMAFDSEESGLRGSNYYVSQMTAEDKKNAVVMINMDSLAVGDNMHIYGSGGTAGFARDQGLAIAVRLGLNVTTQSGENPLYPAGTTGDWSDHVAFKKAGIPYGYLESTNWTLGAKDGYTQTVKDGEVWHTGKDNLSYIQSNYPGRIEEHLSTFTQLLTTLILEMKEPAAGTLTLSKDKASMTEKRTIDVEFELPSTSVVGDLTWTYGDKPLTEWKKWSTVSPAGYNGTPFIYLEGTPVVTTTASGKKVNAKITFDQIYGTTNLSGTFRSRYPEMIGVHDLSVLGKTGNIIAKAPIKLNAYDSFHTYDEIKPEIDAITANAKTGRYIETRVLGKSVQGRDIYFTILAKDKASVDQYVNETLPAMLENPKALQDKIKSGKLTDYKVPIWLNNIHPDEAPGIDAILNIFRTMSKEDSVTYSTYNAANVSQPVTLNVDQALNNVIFLMNYTENPDGRFLNTRANADGFDLNRDNSNQTQPETRIVTSEIAKWSPLTFLDFHGFVGQFLIEPCTPPHDPNFEFDLLIDDMVDQANAMGRAGTASTKYTVYHIPYEEARKKAENPSYTPIANATGWDDASPAYTAVYAMHHGALGHTLEIPELNEDSTNALYYAAMAATKYVIDNKKKLFLNQLEVYKRGIEGTDSYNVDKYLVDANYKEIGRPRKGEVNFFPEYYVLPVDKGLQKNALETHKMVQYLLRNGVKVEKTTAAVTFGSKVYPAGTYVVNMHQAKRGYANLVLYDGIDVSDFSAMYADIIQSFSYMRGFDRDIIHEANIFAGKTAQVTSVTIPTTTITGYTTHYVIKNTNNDAIQSVNELVYNKQSVTMLTYGGVGYETGDFLVSYSNLKKVQAKYLLDVVPFEVGGDTRGKVLKTPKVAATGVPAYVLKQLGFTVLTDQATSDVLVNTSGSNSYISAGKPYIGFGRSVMSTLKSSNLLTGFNYGSTGSSHEGLFKVNLDQTSVITAPYDASDYLYTISGSYITAVPAGAKVIATVSDSADFFKAGWWPGHDIAKGKTLAFTYKTSSLNVTVFSNELTNRDHPQFQFRLLANAIYAAEPDLGLGDVVDDGTGESIPTPTPTPKPTSTPTQGVPNPGNSSPTPTPTVTPAPEATPTPSPDTKPTPSPKPTEAPVFNDLGPVTSWAKSSIDALTSKGIIKGVDGANNFAPLKEVTRAEFITMLVRAFNLSNENASVSFNDVKKDAWYYSFIASAVEAGVVKGIGGGKFDPNRPITREEMAIMAANALKIGKDIKPSNTDETLSKFKDKGSIASYAKDSVALLSEAGVINGTTEDTFSSKGIANRAQAAVIIDRMLNLP